MDCHSQYESSSCRIFPRARRLSSLVLLAHVNIYLKYLYPIMPVIRPDQVLNDCSEPEKLTPQRYAFIASLCAATHVQLKLDGAEAKTDASFGHASSDGPSAMSGEELLAEAVNARKEYDISEKIDTENLLTSFFLFAAYGNLDRQDQAWFYLSQSTTMAYTLGLHRESSYSKLDGMEAEERRRIFWLLFVTERYVQLGISWIGQHPENSFVGRMHSNKPSPSCCGAPYTNRRSFTRKIQSWNTDSLTSSTSSKSLPPTYTIGFLSVVMARYLGSLPLGQYGISYASQFPCKECPRYSRSTFLSRNNGFRR
jgi:hypothetical protein